MKIDDATENELNLFFEKKPNLSERTKKSYRESIGLFCEFTGMTLPELLEEAQNEQIAYINDNNQIITPNVDKTAFKYYLDKFKQRELLTKKESTLKLRLSNIKAVYKTLIGKNNIKIPEIQEFKTKVWNNKNKKGLSQHKIKKIIEKSNTKYKAIFAFASCTGMRIGDILQLTCKDWLKSIGLKTIDEAMYEKKDIIGFFEFYPQKTPKIWCQVFNTPESNKLIQNFLIERKLSKENITENSLLFLKKPSKHTITVNFYSNKINNILHDEEVEELKTKGYTYEEIEGLTDQEIEKLKKEGITKEKLAEKIEKISYFHPHALRSYFTTTVGNNISNLKIAARLAGHAMPEATDDNYIRFSKEQIYSHYIKLIPYLTVLSEVEVKTITDKDLSKLKHLAQENMILKKRMNSIEDILSIFDNLTEEEIANLKKQKHNF
jgi:integrase